MRMNRIITNCRGLTLVELMISMVLSLMIMGGAISIFMGSKETFRLEEDLSRAHRAFAGGPGNDFFDKCHAGQVSTPVSVANPSEISCLPRFFAGHR